MSPFEALVAPPRRIPWLLRPALWLARRLAGREPTPGLLLAHSTKAALGIGIFEALAPKGPRDLERRALATARIVASVVGGCPFCTDMNAATWHVAGLSAAELRGLLLGELVDTLSMREKVAARYARALSLTPVRVDAALARDLREHFIEKERVILAVTIAQVNFWTRLNQGLGVKAVGFFDPSTCVVTASG
jgi:alkylhydroperoxidase family enzyme